VVRPDHRHLADFPTTNRGFATSARSEQLDVERGGESPPRHRTRPTPAAQAVGGAVCCGSGVLDGRAHDTRRPGLGGVRWVLVRLGGMWRKRRRGVCTKAGHPISYTGVRPFALAESRLCACRSAVPNALAAVAKKQKKMKRPPGPVVEASSRGGSVVGGRDRRRQSQISLRFWPTSSHSCGRQATQARVAGFRRQQFGFSRPTWPPSPGRHHQRAVAEGQYTAHRLNGRRACGTRPPPRASGAPSLAINGCGSDSISVSAAACLGLELPLCDRKAVSVHLSRGRYFPPVRSVHNPARIASHARWSALSGCQGSSISLRIDALSAAVPESESTLALARPRTA